MGVCNKVKENTYSLAVGRDPRALPDLTTLGDKQLRWFKSSYWIRLSPTCSSKGISGPLPGPGEEVLESQGCRYTSKWALDQEAMVGMAPGSPEGLNDPEYCQRDQQPATANGGSVCWAMHWGRDAIRNAGSIPLRFWFYVLLFFSF